VRFAGSPLQRSERREMNSRARQGDLRNPDRCKNAFLRAERVPSAGQRWTMLTTDSVSLGMTLADTVL
jgi:hypothetical protein